VSGLQVELAGTLDDLERLRAEWEQLPWQREEAAWDYFVARLRTRPDVIGPYAGVVLDGDVPVAGLAGRLETRHLATLVGLRSVYSPRVRLLQVVDGGVVSAARAALPELAGLVERALRDEAVDAVALPPLEVGSELAAAFDALGRRFDRQPFIAPWTRRYLDLPAAFDDFLASLGPRTRENVRRNGRKVERAFGERLSVAVLRGPGDADRLVRDADEAARRSYQRRLGAGFADTPEQRALAQVGLEHGWLRGYLLYVDGTPVSYWLCSVYGETMLIKTGGFDEAYAEHRLGVYLLMRVIEDACGDPALRVLDFGPGDAAYKEQFSNRSRVERNAVLFAPTLRARRINATRTAILGPARAAKHVLDATRLTDRVRGVMRR
jgi:hypothetical protein